MNKIYICITFVLLIANISCVVMDLPDIEISGPSPLKSVLEKKGDIGADLYIPDIMDSLKPVIPALPYDEIILPHQKKQNSHALYADLANTGVKAGIILSELFSKSDYLTGYADYYTPDNKWYSRNVVLGLHHVSHVSLIDVNVLHAYYHTPKIITYQSDSAIQLMYDFNYGYELVFPFKVKLMSEFDAYNNESELSDTKYDKQYWNNKLIFKYLLSRRLELGLEANYIQNTAAFAINIDKAPSDTEEFLGFAKSISLSFSKERIVPGINLSKRFYPFNGSTLLISQESGYELRDNYKLLQEQPWQYNQKDAIVSFYPLNTHVSMIYNNLNLAHIPIELYADCGIRYSVDKPVLESKSVAGDLPVSVPEALLESNFKTGFKARKGNYIFNQSILVNKGWLAEHNYKGMSYSPLFTLDSSFEYSIDKVRFNLGFMQCYNTKYEAGLYLRDVLDLNAGINYNLNQNMDVYLKLSNPFEKGKVVYRDLPERPAEIMLGFFYKF